MPVLGFLPEQFSKSIERNNHSRIIYRNDDIARLVKVDMKRKFLFSHMKVHEKQE